MTDLRRQASQPVFTFEIDSVKYSASILGSDAVGSTSLVYLAQRLLPDGAASGERLILKRFLAPAHRLFEIERDVLLKVASLDYGRLGQHFPRVIAAQQVIFDGQPSDLLLMEHAGDRPVTFRLPLNEAEALALVRHYLACLHTLFKAGFTCWDRKTKDFYWKSPAEAPPDGELRTIDWNAAEPYSITNAHHDLVKAGQLSYELLTRHPLLRRKGSTTYQFGSEWRRISFGTQEIVRALLAGVPDLVRNDMAEPEKGDHLSSRLESWQQQCKNMEDLLGTGMSQRLMDDARAHLENQRPLEALQRTSIVALKLSTAADGWEGSINWNTAEWKETHDRAYAEAMVKLDVLASRRQELADVHKPVGQVVWGLQGLLRDNTQLSPEQELSSARWLLLASALAEGDDAAQSVRVRAVRALEAHEKDLSQGNCLAALKHWDSMLALQSLHPQLKKSFTIIQTEAHLRELEMRAADAREKGDYSRALDELQRISDMLGQLGRADADATR